MSLFFFFHNFELISWLQGIPYSAPDTWSRPFCDLGESYACVFVDISIPGPQLGHILYCDHQAPRNRDSPSLEIDFIFRDVQASGKIGQKMIDTRECAEKFL